ncbi:DUF1194 domain-containing protein [Ruegeria sp. AD91A]|uniref:DUF1194 domain-containing protein n=2 Tax=Ruegeria TaxID=97050 RepID=UPI000E4D7B81|nr:DUF1194 domain-containing protein [Ruegeria sp. AD91A]AXT27270.1 DUF1194 domain-containing protein [Ruegeria sp. AD91A]
MHLLRAILASICLAPSAQACDLALALAVDVSGSVDSNEYRIQMDGLAAGLRDPVVSEALVRGQAQLMLVQWTGSSRQQVTIPWTRIDSFSSLDRFADQVAADPRIWRNFSTAIGEALHTTLDAFDAVSDCKRRLIDLSGDGVSNEGVEPTQVHAALRNRGIVVNALAIEESEPDLTAYFFENVIVGEGAFVVSASGFADYPDRIRKKLLREVTQQTAGLK